MLSKPRETPTSFGCAKVCNQCHNKTIFLADGKTSKGFCGRHYWMCKMCDVPFLKEHGERCKICSKVKAAIEQREKEEKEGGETV